MRGKLRSRANVLMLCALLAPAAAKADVVLPEKGVPLPFFRPDVDTDLLFDTLVGTAFYGALVDGRNADQLADKLCSLMLQGVRPRQDREPR